MRRDPGSWAAGQQRTCGIPPYRGESLRGLAVLRSLLVDGSRRDLLRALRRAALLLLRLLDVLVLTFALVAPRFLRHVTQTPFGRRRLSPTHFREGYSRGGFWTS